MPEVIFQHPRVKKGNHLVIDTGADEIVWGYHLNVAKFSTYGGEVVQILSVYIDDLTIGGTVRSYEEAEDIYEYFMEYFSVATQGPVTTARPDERFDQTPVVMFYPERNWQLEIQPLRAPGFMYSLETVAPKWQLEAHMVDTGLNTDSLKALVIQQTKVESAFGEFNLSGFISPASGNPANNPFIAPLTPTTKNPKTGNIEFVPQTAQEITSGVGKIADYYTNLLKSYLNGNFEDLAKEIGSKPVFGRPAEQGETPDELISSSAKGSK